MNKEWKKGQERMNEVGMKDTDEWWVLKGVFAKSISWNSN